MHIPALPIDSQTHLTRRIVVAILLSFAAIRLVPPLVNAGGGQPPEAEARILPTVPTPIDLPGPGLLLEPFEADDVDHTALGWALLDRSAGAVLVLDSAGRVHRRLGRRGAGPGELERPSRIALGDRAQVAVLDATGQRLDVFPVSGLPRRIPLTAHDCSGTFGDEVVRYAMAWWVLRRCFDGPNADIEVLRVPSNGIPERVERRALTRMNSDPHLVPILLAQAGVLYAGSNRDPCLVEVGTAPATGTRLCLPRPNPIEIPDSLVTRLFGDLGRRAAAVGLDLEIPTHYPGLVGARVSALGPVIRTILADGSDAWAFESDGALRVLAPTADARVEPGESHWLLLRDDGAGLRVWTVPILPPARTPR